MDDQSRLVIHVPHASTFIPDDERPYFAEGEIAAELVRMTDHYCDDLFGCGRTMVRFPYSRLVCDPERFRDNEKEPMHRLGMGFAYARGSSLQKLRCVGPEDEERVLRLYYDPHHRRLEDAVREKLDRHGRCLIVDGHSFSGEPLPYEQGGGEDRPDVCVGTDPFHTPDALAEETERFFRRLGYSVSVDAPFSGSMVPMAFYRRDSRVGSVMIELNRDLYMDRRANRNGHYAVLKKQLGDYLSIAEDWIGRQ